MSKEKVGTAECILCGLRASSKNVAIRSVFAHHPKDKLDLACYERCVRIVEEKNPNYQQFSQEDIDNSSDASQKAARIAYNKDQPKNLVGFAIVNYEKGGIDSVVSWLREVVKLDPALSYLNVMLCNHQWEQDPGTETV